MANTCLKQPNHSFEKFLVSRLHLLALPVPHQRTMQSSGIAHPNHQGAEPTDNFAPYSCAISALGLARVNSSFGSPFQTAPHKEARYCLAIKRFFVFEMIVKPTACQTCLPHNHVNRDTFKTVTVKQYPCGFNNFLRVCNLCLAVKGIAISSFSVCTIYF